MRNTDAIEWTHPIRGRVIEILCERHRTELFSALKRLAIGCTGMTSGERCDLCEPQP